MRRLLLSLLICSCGGASGVGQFVPYQEYPPSLNEKTFVRKVYSFDVDFVQQSLEVFNACGKANYTLVDNPNRADVFVRFNDSRTCDGWADLGPGYYDISIPANCREYARMFVLHEIGHMYGLGHVEGTFMSAALARTDYPETFDGMCDLVSE